MKYWKTCVAHITYATFLCCFSIYRKTTFYRDRGLRAKVPAPMCVSNVTRILHSLSASEIYRNAIFPIGEVRFLASRQKSCTFATYEWRVRRTYGAIAAGNNVSVWVYVCMYASQRYQYVLRYRPTYLSKWFALLRMGSLRVSAVDEEVWTL